MHGDAAHREGDGLGAGDTGAAAWHVLGGDAEVASRLPYQHILAVPQEGEGAPVECHIVRVACGNAGARAEGMAAVPVPLPAYTGGGES